MKAREFQRIRTLVDVVVPGKHKRLMPAGTYATIVDASAEPVEHYIAERKIPDPSPGFRHLYEVFDVTPDQFEIVDDGAGFTDTEADGTP